MTSDKPYVLCTEEKKLLKKVYNKIINSMHLQNRMDPIFMNSKNNLTSYPPRLLMNLQDKISLKRSDKYLPLSNLSIYEPGRNIKKSYKNNTFKIPASTWNEEFELPDGSYSYQIFKITLNISTKKHGENTDNLSISINVNIVQNIISFRIKTGYYLEPLTNETIKLLASNKSKMKIKDENGENVLHLEIVGVVLVHCNIVNNDYQQDSRVLYTSLSDKTFGQLLDISLKYFIFLKHFESEFSYIEVWLPIKVLNSARGKTKLPLL